MLKILGRIPKGHFHVACSGGSDSMVIVDFLKRYPKNKFDLIHFNHGTKSCFEAEDFIRKYSKETGIELKVGHIKETEKKKDESQEEFWRRNRYEFFSKFIDEPIVLCHHLNDCIETYVMTALCGNPMLIPYYNPKYNIIRPFLTTSKEDIEEWAERHDVKYVLDKSNLDDSIKRNFVRHVMMPDILKINPGIGTTISKKVIAEFKKSNVPV